MLSPRITPGARVFCEDYAGRVLSLYTCLSPGETYRREMAVVKWDDLTEAQRVLTSALEPAQERYEADRANWRRITAAAHPEYPGMGEGGRGRRVLLGGGTAR